MKAIIISILFLLPLIAIFWVLAYAISKELKKHD